MPAPADRADSRRLPEVVFFDLGDTLVRAYPSWAGVYRQGLAEWGIDVRADELEQALYEATQSDAWTFEGPFEATAAASYERIKRFDAVALARLGYSEVPDGAFRSIEAAFERATSWHIFGDVVPAIEALDAAGPRLALISNWLWGGPELLHSLELARHFQALIISARVGYQKPHPRIFEHALEVMAVAPEQAIHVGDNYRADVLGARRVGITPVLIDRRVGDPAAIRAEHGDPDLPVVRDLLDLLDLLSVARPAAARQVSARSA